MTRTNGLLAGLLVLSVAGVAGGVGYITQQNIATYESELASAVADARAELRPQGIDVSVQTVSTSMLGIKREERFVFRKLDPAMELFAINQQVTIEPFRAYGTFGIDEKSGMMAMFAGAAPDLLGKQQGSWQLDPVNDLLNVNYRTGAVNQSMPDGTQVSVKPLTLTAVAGAANKGKTRVNMSIPDIALESPMGKGSLKGFDLLVRSHEVKGETFVDHVRYKIGQVSVDSPFITFMLRDFAMESGQIIDGNDLASLMTINFSALNVNSSDKDLSVEPTRLSLFVNGINWPALEQATKEINDLSSDPALADDGQILSAAIEAWSRVAAEGLTIKLETLESRFIFNDLGPAGMGASGDVLLSGGALLEPGMAETLMYDWPQRVSADLMIDGSRSLMQSPLAEHVVSLIDAGYIAQSSDRLQTHIRYVDGMVTANDLPLDGMLATGM
ncbi:MAG: hypothetical protein CMI13_14980 [Oleibacter sp.]|nr:hypothetical protein [Thalassolituus sp.]|tara:strand:- start:317 stop:1648 length:1332 start_codon:yes stop_codon:yes gene_type:complete